MEHVAWSCRTSCLSPGTPKLPSLMPMVLQIGLHHLPGPLLRTCHPAVSRHVCILIRKAHPPPPALSRVLPLLCPAPLLSVQPHHNYPILQNLRTTEQRGNHLKTTLSLWNQVRQSEFHIVSSMYTTWDYWTWQVKLTGFWLQNLFLCASVGPA